jgi:hypothetical protein
MLTGRKTATRAIKLQEPRGINTHDLSAEDWGRYQQEMSGTGLSSELVKATTALKAARLGTEQEQGSTQEAAEHLRLVESAAGFAMERAWHGRGPQIGRSTQGACTDEGAEQKRPQQSAEAARADLASFLLAPNGNGEATSDGLASRAGAGHCLALGGCAGGVQRR